MAWSPLQELVTLHQAKQHVKLPLDVYEDDADLQLKLLIAHEVVMDFVMQRLSGADDWADTVSGWTAATAPKRVLAAILVQFAHMQRFRGDDDPNEMGGRWKAEVAGEFGSMSPDVVALLWRLRDPAVS